MGGFLVEPAFSNEGVLAGDYPAPRCIDMDKKNIAVEYLEWGGGVVKGRGGG